ncbi:hypothetical protein HORIV_47270 [Vreelandella olivaria]|uniref:Uncharacterized protein n=1 Tax=Vreelandella olivaria TaxID=390919 RepID=A0ABM7GNG5_9GAMM|nr:hypothetical protein HORIV_47270 [Halomonas olivaria]
MGASLTWMACRSIDIKNIQKKLKVRKTFDKEKAEFFGVVTLEEQVFIWDCGVGISPVLNHDDLRRSISKGHEVYFCVAEEHVMFSEASLWVDGQEIWGVTHRGKRSLTIWRKEVICRIVTIQSKKSG